jgi:glucose-6-phosphate-specific signal transduction histidine kinase
MDTATKRTKAPGLFVKLRGLSHHFAVAAAYACCYVVLHALSVSHWNLPAGLRVTCLLLVPYRYWPALIVGELLPTSYFAWQDHDQFGWAWAALAALPPILLNAPVFAWCRRHMPLFRAGQINLAGLLSPILLGALMTTLGDVVALMALHMPNGAPGPAITARIVLGYFLGNDLGALTLAPTFLVLRARFNDAGRRVAWRAVLRSRFIRDCAVAVVPPLLALLWMTSAGNDDTRQIYRIAMFLPVAWMTLRHGWQGAAVAGTLASIAVQLTMTVVRDPSVIQAQALIAFAISTLLLLGSRLIFRSEIPSRDSADALCGFQLAQQGLYQEEMRLRQAAEALEDIGQSIRDNQKRLLDRLRPVLPASLEQVYARHAAITQHEMYRLADALHPRAWRERGVPETFKEGPLAQAAALVGASYECHLTRGGVDKLAPDVHMMLYRLACEVMVYVLAREPVRGFHLQIRGGYTHGRRWVVMRMTCARATPTQRDKPATEWKQVVSLLGTNGQGMASIRSRVQIYGGAVHQRDGVEQIGITLLLHDALRMMGAASPDIALQHAASF